MSIVSVSLNAQDDDVYFVPSKSAKAAEYTTSSNQSAYTALGGNEATSNWAAGRGNGHWDVDAYNRHSKRTYGDAKPYLEDSLAYDDYDDGICSSTARLVRFHSPYGIVVASPYYVDYYYDLAFYDPWFYGHWGWGLYNWYDPWYYGTWGFYHSWNPWYGGWYGSWAWNSWHYGHINWGWHGRWGRPVPSRNFSGSYGRGSHHIGIDRGTANRGFSNRNFSGRSFGGRNGSAARTQTDLRSSSRSSSNLGGRSAGFNTSRSRNGSGSTSERSFSNTRSSSSSHYSGSSHSSHSSFSSGSSRGGGFAGGGRSGGGGGGRGGRR